jgi:alkanesulfonate monooxygenase SsuD/methylene tetrahydromethanopterin reductase-like flavin-dependent oxidoreductase (luciferase family)
MEFAVFLNGFIPGPAAHDSEMQHTSYMREAEYAVFADKHNWKYCWFGEHHSLTEYSQLSAPEVAMGYVASQTDYIHLGTAINSLSPRKEHPARYAERAATLDHYTNRRFEWGTGRGAGSHEMATFNILDKDSTKPEWAEVVREIPRMWEQVDYEFHGETFTVPYPHNILPKPYGPGHPPIWVACGNPPTFNVAGEMGIGAIAFNFEPIFALRGRIDAYKEGIANCTDPIGQFKNDNVMITNSVICCETREEAREIALRKGRGYLVSMVNLYHDTMPKSTDAITWPSKPVSLYDMVVHARGQSRRRLRTDRGVGRCRHGPARVRSSDRGSVSRGDPGLSRTVRRQGDPRVRQGPNPLHGPLSRVGQAEVRHLRTPAARRRVARAPAGGRAQGDLNRSGSVSTRLNELI